MMDKSYLVGRADSIRRKQPGHVLTRLGMLVVLLCALLSTQTVFAQGTTISGKVTDGTGAGLPGVTVQIKGTTKGTTTDGNGTYQLANVPGGSTLVFSSIGYTTQEVAAGSRASIDASLVEDNKTLNEVVVVGYGTQKVKDATGSVSTLSTKDFNKGVIASPEQLLQGRVAGVQITPASGEPGAGINVQI
ncbi:MAG: SusC/RagA family TonB-linked outer membrane protein, partial [Cytophagaceae bacterium]